MSRGNDHKKTFATMSVKDAERMAKKALKDSGLTIKKNVVYSNEHDASLNSTETDKLFQEMSRRPFS